MGTGWVICLDEPFSRVYKKFGVSRRCWVYGFNNKAPELARNLKKKYPSLHVFGFYSKEILSVDKYRCMILFYTLRTYGMSPSIRFGLKVSTNSLTVKTEEHCDVKMSVKMGEKCMVLLSFASSLLKAKPSVL